jgi:hypothetical protein
MAWRREKREKNMALWGPGSVWISARKYSPSSSNVPNEMQSIKKRKKGKRSTMKK